MMVQEAAKCVMKITGVTQQEVAERNGLAGQSSVGTFLRSKSMRVDNLLMILNTCGYELVARSADGRYPEIVIGKELSAADESEKHEDVKDDTGEDARIMEMVRKAVAEVMEDIGGMHSNRRK